MKKYTNQLGTPLNGQTRVMDFGCGWGRILRFFLKDCMAAPQGIDVDPMLIEVDVPLRYVGHVNPLTPTSFPEGSFDVVTGTRCSLILRNMPA